MKIVYSVVFLAILAGCSSAKKSMDIQATRISIAPYASMGCKDLVAERKVLEERLEFNRQAVDKAYNSDKNTEIVTWVLFAPAAFFLEGNQQQATDFANTKGQYEAVNEALTANKCYS